MIVFVLTLIGLILRSFRLQELSGFDFDAETASFWLKSLLVDHKLSLVGQEISVGGIFIGPFYYYFLAPFYQAMKMDPIAGNIAVTLMSAATMILVFLATKNIFDKRTAIIAMIIYVFSTQIIAYDRTTAPSNLLMLFSVGTLYLLTDHKKFNIPKLTAIGLLFGLSWSVHPTAVILIPIAICFLSLEKRQVGLPQTLFVTVIAGLFILPVILFEIRHDYLMTHRLIVFLSGNAFTTNSYPFIFKLLINVRTLLSMFFQLLVPLGNSRAFLLLLPFLLWSYKTTQKKIIQIWTLIPLVLLSLYPAHVPDYYFLLVIPVLLIFFAAFIKTILPNSIQSVVLGAFIILNMIQTLRTENLGSLHYKKQAVNYVVHESGGRPFQVNYQTWLGQNNGFRYLFFLRGNEPSINAKERYIIVSPKNLSSEKGEEFGMIKVVKKYD